MRNVLFATMVASLFAAASPTLANPSQEAEEDYPGWLAAQKAAAAQQAETPKGHVIYRSNQHGR